MDTKRLNEIITELKDSCYRSKASFGIHHIGGHEEHYIKANPDGLKLFAIELLEATVDSEDIVAHPQKNIHVLDCGGVEWIHPDSDIILEYVSPTLDSRDNIHPQTFDQPKSNILTGFVMITILLALISIFILGIYQIFAWIL